MKILIDILHPAHVHFLKNFIWQMRKKGHEILITARDKEVTLDLLKAYNIRFIKISRISKSKLMLGLELLTRTYKLYKIAKKFKPDLLMGNMGPSISIVGKLLEIPSLVFYNNETAVLSNFYVERLATAFITSTSYESKVHGKHITYNSYHELAYLHPDYFKPNKDILKELNIENNEKFFLLRLVSFKSSHDIGVKGINNPLALVNLLKQYGKVFISSEKPLPKQLEQYRLRIAPEKLHDMLYYAEMCIGESATLASEAACLGVPAIYIASTMRGYTNEQEKRYGLVYNFISQEKAIIKIKQLLNKKSLKNEFAKKRDKMLKEKIDVTSWMINFVENRKWLKPKN